MGAPMHPKGFSAVDRSGDLAYYIGVLDRAALVWRDIREAIHDRLGLREGDRILEAGCGTGEVARELARRVGPRGRVVALDRRMPLLAEARRRAAGSDLPVVYQLGDIYRLPFADRVFDACRVERVFQHLADPTAAFRELRRVLRPGGRLVIAEADQETRTLDAPNR